MFEPVCPPAPTCTRSSKRDDRDPDVDGLLEAILVVAAGLDLEDTLGSIVRSAMSLVDARYGALGVDGDSHDLARFIHRGVAPEVAAEIGELPEGLGILGLFHDDADTAPVRIHDISEHPASIGFPAAHPPMTTFLGAPITVRGTIYGTIYLTEKRDGRGFTADDETIIHTLAAAAGIAIENARLFEQSQSRLSWIEANGDVATELLSGTDTADALAMVARKARALTGSDMTFVALPDDTSGEPTHLVIRVASGHNAHELDGQIIPIDGSTTGAAFRSRAPSRVRALAYDATARTATRFGPAIIAPMCVGDDVRGVLVGLRRDGGPVFTEETVGLLSSFAGQAALAMSMADAAARLRDLDVLAERDRIARDLHDHVIQRIFAAGLSLQSTVQRTTTPDVKRRLTATIDDLQDVIQDIRTAIFDLHGSQTAANRLRENLHAVIDELCEGQPIHFAVRMSGPLAVVDVDVAAHVIAVVREAVSNAVRHSGAGRGVVAVTVADVLTVTVSDDGSGIPEGVPRSGLRNLGSRASECGGELVVNSPLSAGGTEIVWTVPVT